MAFPIPTTHPYVMQTRITPLPTPIPQKSHASFSVEAEEKKMLFAVFYMFGAYEP